MNTELNVILVTVDCLRPDHLGSHSYPRETSPNIDALAARAEMYTSVFSHGGGTPESFPSLLAGTPPPVTIRQCDLGNSRGLSVISEAKSLGYKTAAFNSNPYLSRYFGYDRDFDFFYHNLAGQKRKHVVVGRGMSAYLKLLLAKTPIISGEKLTEEAISWIGGAKKEPFIAWLHYMDAHVPYLPPSRFVRQVSSKSFNRYRMPWLYRKMHQSNGRVYNSIDPSMSRLSASEVAQITNYYDGGIRYVDYCLGKLLGYLEKAGHLANTYVILTADHGELIGEHGVVDHGYLYDQVLRVPLIVAGGNLRHRRIDEPLTHLTTHEIIRSLVFGRERQEIPKSEWFADFGSGIVSSVVDIYRDIYSCRTTKWKYIETTDRLLQRTVEELYNLSGDPGESHNIARERTDLVATFHQRISDFREAYIDSKTEEPRTRTYTQKEEDELNAKLRELGYE